MSLFICFAETRVSSKPNPSFAEIYDINGSQNFILQDRPKQPKLE